jgi:hypothetical protein
MLCPFYDIGNGLYQFSIYERQINRNKTAEHFRENYQKTV